MIQEIKLRRLFSGNNSSAGALYFPGECQPECFIIEDEHRAVKVRGETRIDAGRYEIKKRIVLSEKTKTYRKLYSWFDYHLELQNTPRHKYVYIHSGNKESHTEGCLLPNYNCMMLEDINEYEGGRSRDAFKEIYRKVSAWLNNGDQVFINITNEEDV